MASKFVDEPKRTNRFSDVDEEPRRRLPPIKGYEDMPIVSLEEATFPLKQLVPEIEHMVWTVKGDCDKPEKGLTSDGLASIKLYSMDWEPREKSFYAILNKTLRAENRQQLKPWFLYLRLVLTALTQLSSDRLTVFRGVKRDLRAEYPEGSTFIWWGFSSCTSSARVLENDQFLGKKGRRTLFTIECDTGKDIRKHSFYEAEDEILLLPGRQFKVVSCLDSGNDLYMIHIKEMTPPFPLLFPVSLVDSSVETKHDFDAETSFNRKDIKQPPANDYKTLTTKKSGAVPKPPLITNVAKKTNLTDTDTQRMTDKRLTSNNSDINRKMIDFVQDSYYKFGKSQQRIKIKSVEEVVNPQLKANFERCKRTLGLPNVVTLLHGTKIEFARGIASEGFMIPTSFKRNPENDAEGELKFGKALYFAFGKKATEYGKNTLVVTDCILAKVQTKETSELKLTPDIIHRRGYHTIHYKNKEEGPVNQEWAIYNTDQCLPLYIIDYEIIDDSDLIENAVIDKIRAMSCIFPDHALLQQALFGTDNQCKAVLKFVGDLASQSTPQSSTIMHSLLSRAGTTKTNLLLKHPNETIRILFLRALWLIGRDDREFQLFVYQQMGPDALIESLVSGYDDVCWRACGVLANMAAAITEIRRLLVTKQVLQHLMILLQRGLESQDKLCILTVVNLLANITCTEYAVMKQKEDIQLYLDENLLDHPNKEIQEAANRFFCNMIGKGTVTPDWKRAGYHDTVSAPNLE